MDYKVLRLKWCRNNDEFISVARLVFRLKVVHNKHEIYSDVLLSLKLLRNSGASLDIQVGQELIIRN